MFNAVHTTDWHEPETLEHWREQWAAAVNTKFEEKGWMCVSTTVPMCGRGLT